MLSGLVAFINKFGCQQKRSLMSEKGKVVITHS